MWYYTAVFLIKVDRLKPYHDPSMVQFKGKSLPLDPKFTGDADDADDVEYEID
eukprot:SAG31_NODE_38624_length_294_cov_3.020513_1_plen_52_part_01